MHNAKTYIGEAHPGNILSKSHILSPLRSVIHCPPPRREREIISIAFRWNISDSSQAPAVSPLGIVDIISGSTKANCSLFKKGTWEYAPYIISFHTKISPEA